MYPLLPLAAILVMAPAQVPTPLIADVAQVPAPMIADAAEALRAKDYPAAEAICRGILAANPGDPKALLNLGLSLEGQGRVLDAMNHWDSLKGQNRQGLPTDDQLDGRIAALKAGIWTTASAPLEAARQELAHLLQEREELLRPFEEEKSQARLKVENRFADSRKRLDVPVPAKDEFETTAQYQGRVDEHQNQMDDLNGKLQSEYEALDSHLQPLIDERIMAVDAAIELLQNKKLPIPSLIKLGSFNADKEEWSVEITQDIGGEKAVFFAIFSLDPTKARDLKARKDVLWAEGEASLSNIKYVEPAWLVDPILGKIALQDVYMPSAVYGTWIGTIAEIYSSYSTSYRITLALSQKDNVITGKSHIMGIENIDRRKVSVAINGISKDRDIKLQESSVNTFSSAWNGKVYDLKRKSKDELAGSWYGWREGSMANAGGLIVFKKVN